ncbi:HupE/UreJ family protein [Nitratireductor sp. StC3]|uniref:HupE/UreJ family protein n=1 Tax=Nitratireductor sp. StC3 TaxID=2126741 RepID=UPI001FE07331|nr:HupE/UreJ family protein [Nitratireductor sp. StC3]
MKRTAVMIAASILAASATPALAHSGPDVHGAFAAGFAHPFSGADHALAMVATGVWAASLGGRALWQLPLAFITIMVAGFLLAHAGTALPFVEPVILASVVAIGLLAALALPVPVRGAAALVGLFALFHGHAHGAELGSSAGYAVGFVAATALLLAAGGALVQAGGRLLRRAPHPIARGAGAAAALGGLWLALAG